MVWEGEAQVTAKMRGYVPLGEHAVPRRVGYSLTGAKGSPDLNMSFEVIDGRPECVEIVIQAKPYGRGIRTADLHVFNIDAMTITVFTSVALTATRKLPDGAKRFEPIADDGAWAAEKSVMEARKVRRGAVTLDELEQVARVYREHFDQAPAKAVELLLGYSERTAGRRIQQAREARLLPTTSPGKKKA